jgi:4-alpha-glucanotransferase
MLSERSSGILAHISSLPSPCGIGDIGHSSYNFLSFLRQSDQSYWQFLPTGPTSDIFDNSPYMSNSAFAGNPLFISPDLLYKDGLIAKESLSSRAVFSPHRVSFAKARIFKDTLLKEAFSNFTSSTNHDFALFKKENQWLTDYAIFMTARELFDQTPWCNWPPALTRRDPKVLSEFRQKYQKRIAYYQFEQFTFFRQWRLLKEQAVEQGVLLFGDLPIYVGYDSVDVWANQEIFVLDESSRQPTHVSGVPPDYFSATGQRWGNPLYDWQNSSLQIRERLTQWWANRLAHLFSQVDVARIDHFRGFESYWSIPAANETAEKGRWLKGPGFPFFKEMRKRLGRMNIVAEDLGIITKEVASLRDDLEFPGMKVLQFAFDGNPHNDFLPHNFKNSQCIVYTGTHDNDTTLGWYLSDQLDDRQRDDIKRQANSHLHDNRAINHDLIYLAQSSISTLCIFPLQDILGFGGDCRMNTPGVAKGNWRWRCAEAFLSEEISAWLRESTRRFGRARRERKLESK